ncbi:hypothetical protein B0H17DRAFT_1018608 [Mycena rosella]|uniref:Uncharacterized protein n=1 Tax=Mycena rosella TaxID=1033263 RepID=A0AAD7G7P9_MYCRO|nr:hypothetical protein B0H17DRAFT_1018608 [Mycena rosella]
MASSSAIQLARDANIPIQSYPPPPGSPPPLYGETPKASSSGIQLTRDADYLIESFLPATKSVPPFEAPQLPLPYCVPQLTTGFDAPFARGYNPLLESVDISQEQLLAFIDGLNLAMTASPPLRCVNIVGMAIGFVPYHWAMIAGAAIQTAAKTGMRILSKTLTDRYLRAANLRLFKPRGLSVRICTTAAMQHLVLHTPIAAGPSKLKRFGRGVGSVLMRIPLPLSSILVHAVADAPPKVPAMEPGAYPRSTKLLATQRRVGALAGHALPLDFDMPKPAKAQGVMDTMGGWGVKFDSWMDGRRQTKAEKARLGLELQQRGGQPQASGGLLGGLGGGLLGGGGGLLGRGIGVLAGRLGGPGGDRHSVDRHSGDRYGGEDHYSGGQGSRSGEGAGGLVGLVGQTRLGRLAVGSRGGGRSRAIGDGNLELQVADADLLEHWKSAQVLWVVIMSSDIDQEIEGIEMAESQEDEESVDERTWRAEMEVEREELEFGAEVERIAAEQKDTAHPQKS